MAISAKFTADFNSFLSAVNNATVAVRTFESGAKSAARDVSRMAESFSGAKIQAEAQRVVTAVNAIGGASKLTATEQEKVNAVLTQAIDKYKALGQQAPAAVQQLAAETAKLEKSSVNLEKSSVNFEKLATSLTSVGTKLTAGVTAPLTAVAGLSVKAAIDFESSFAGIVKTVDKASDGFGNLTDFGRQLQQEMRDLAKEVPVSVNELNKIGETAGQLGIKAENIRDFTRMVAELGVTTNLSTDEASDGMARLANVVQLPQEQLRNLASAIVATGNSGASTERDILAMSLRIGAAGRTAGLSQAEIVGFANALSSLGLEAEAGGTAISRVFIDMSAAVAKGGGDLQAFARVAKMDAKAFADLFNRDAAGAVTTFIEQLGKLNRDGKVMALETLGINEVRLRDTLLRAAQAGDTLRESITLSSKAFHDNNALTRESETRFKTTASQLQILQNKVQDAAISLGNVLLPSLVRILPSFEKLIGFVVRGIEVFSQMPSSVQTFALGLAGVAAATGPIALMTAQVIGLVRELRTLQTFLSAASFVRVAAGVAAGATGIGLPIAAGLLAGGLLLSSPSEASAAPSPSVRMPAASSNALSIGAAQQDALMQRINAAVRVPQQWSQQAGAAFDSVTEKISKAEKAALKAAEANEAFWVSLRTESRVGGATSAIKHLTDDFAGLFASTQRFLTGQGLAPFVASGSLANLPGRMPGMASIFDAGGGIDANRLAPGSQVALTNPQNVFQRALGGVNFGQTLTQAFTGGGDPFRAIGSQFGTSLAQGLTQNMTSTLSKTFLSTVLPIGGALIGQLGDKLLGTLKGVFTGGEEAAIVNPLRDKFIDAAGGLSKLNEQAAAAGVTLNALLAADTEKEFKAAVDELNAAFAHRNGLLERQAELQDQIAQVTDDLVPKWDDVNAAMDRYGISLDKAGGAVNQLAAQQSWQKMTDDIDMMLRAGIDVGGMLQDMSDEISALVSRSLAFGTTIPSNMRPYVEELHRSGQLLDANGKKITDLSQIKWGDPLKSQGDVMKEALEALTTELGRIADALAGLPDRARRAADGFETEFGSIRVPPVRVDVEWNVPDGPDGRASFEGFAEGSRGLRYWGERGTPVVVHGWEAIVPQAEYTRLLSRDGGGGGLTRTDVMAIIDAARASHTTVVRNEIGGRHLSTVVVDETNRGMRNGTIKVPKSAAVERVF